MWGWLIALAITAGLAILPLGIIAKYDADGPLVSVTAGPVRFKVYPSKKKERKQEPKRKTEPEVKPKQKVVPAERQSPKQEIRPKETNEPPKKVETKPDAAPKKSEHIEPEKPKEASKGGSILDFIPLVQVALDLLGDFSRKLRVNLLELKLILAADDPCDLAVNYGRAWAAVGNLFPLLERTFVIKKRDVEVECDFTSDETLVIARVDLTITLGRLLYLVVRYGVRALLEYLKIKKSRKGGALK